MHLLAIAFLEERFCRELKPCVHGGDKRAFWRNGNGARNCLRLAGLGAMAERGVPKEPAERTMTNGAVPNLAQGCPRVNHGRRLLLGDHDLRAADTLLMDFNTFFVHFDDA